MIISLLSVRAENYNVISQPPKFHTFVCSDDRPIANREFIVVKHLPADGTTNYSSLNVLNLHYTAEETR